MEALLKHYRDVVKRTKTWTEACVKEFLESLFTGRTLLATSLINHMEALQKQEEEAAVRRAKAAAAAAQAAEEARVKAAAAAARAAEEARVKAAAAV
jgi:hypothetical protein